MDATVIGCNGYIGRHLCRALQAEGHTANGYDLQNRPFVDVANYEQVDLRDATQLDRVRCDVAACFFLAGLTGTVVSFDRYSDFIDTNEKGLLSLLELFRRKGATCRLVFPSTRLVYRGAKGEALREDAPLECRTVYAQNKLAGENYLQMYAACFGVDYTIIRICVPYGSADASMMSYGTIGHFLKSAAEKREIDVFGDGSQRRSLIHIVDLCGFLVALAFHPKASRRILNVGGGEDWSIREIAERLARHVGASVRYSPWNALFARVESGDTVFDSAAAEALLGRGYAHTFEEWIRGLDVNFLLSAARRAPNGQ